MASSRSSPRAEPSGHLGGRGGDGPEVGAVLAGLIKGVEGFVAHAMSAQSPPKLGDFGEVSRTYILLVVEGCAAAREVVVFYDRVAARPARLPPFHEGSEAFGLLGGAHAGPARDISWRRLPSLPATERAASATAPATSEIASAPEISIAADDTAAAGHRGGKVASRMVRV